MPIFRLNRLDRLIMEILQNFQETSKLNFIILKARAISPVQLFAPAQSLPGGHMPPPSRVNRVKTHFLVQPFSQEKAHNETASAITSTCDFWQWPYAPPPSGLTGSLRVQG